MEYARARVKLPPELAMLNRSQIGHVIDESPISPVDAAILRMRYLEHRSMVDIGVEVGYDRSTIGDHVAAGTQTICSTARRMTWPQ